VLGPKLRLKQKAKKERQQTTCQVRVNPKPDLTPCFFPVSSSPSKHDPLRTSAKGLFRAELNGIRTMAEGSWPFDSIFTTL
jgi:hypothetical protein